MVWLLRPGSRHFVIAVVYCVFFQIVSIFKKATSKVRLNIKERIGNNCHDKNKFKKTFKNPPTSTPTSPPPTPKKRYPIVAIPPRETASYSVIYLISAKIIKLLPRQLCVLHFRDSTASPSLQQFLPPYAGRGLVHERERR